MRRPSRPPWAALLVPRRYRDAVVGDALEEARARWGDRGLRRRLWITGCLLVAAVATRRQLMFERRGPRPPRSRESHNMSGALMTDVRYALRSLRRAPGFVTVSVVTLALGIGGVTSMYSLLYGSFIRPLAYDRADQLVVLQTERRDEAFPALSKPDAEDVRTASRALTDMAVWQSWRVTVTPPDGEPTRVMAASIDSRFMSLLGVAPILGRPFNPEDDRAGHAPVVILNHNFWQGRLGGDPSVVGTAMELDGQSYTIVGIAPPGFTDPLAASFALANPPLWRASPESFQTTNRSWRNFWVLGRLAPESSVERLDAELERIASGLAETAPTTNTEVSFGAVPLREHLVGANRATIMILSTAVLLVLLVACANVANLLLTRGTSRGVEHAVRSALGADRLRIVSPLAVESGLLALAGVVGGLLVAAGLARVAGPWTRDLATLVDIRMDLPVLAGAAALSLAVALTFGLVPAWQTVGSASGPRPTARTVGMPGARLRSGLVVIETALAVALLAGAGLLMRSFDAMSRVDLGLDVDRTLVATMTPSTTRYAAPSALDEVVAQTIARTEAIAGVQAAGVVSDLPLLGIANSGWLTRPDRPLPPGEAPPSALYRTVAGEYFRAAGMRLARGRVFNERDDLTAPLVTVINEETARQLFPDESPLGRTVQIMGRVREVIGIVSDVRENGPTAPVPMVVYVPFEQEQQEWATRTSSFVVSVASGDPAAYAALVRQAILDVDGATAINDVRTMADVAAIATRPARFRTGVLTAFACVALTLAAVGLGGVVAFQVSHRRRELGLRMALGATGGGVVKHLVGHGVRISAIGAGIGLVFAGVSSRWLGHLLFEIRPLDPVVFLGVPALFLSVAAAAALVPAVRAARLHPAVALREE